VKREVVKREKIREGVKREAVKREKNREIVKGEAWRREECSCRSESLRIIKNCATVKVAATNSINRVYVQCSLSVKTKQTPQTTDDGHGQW